MTKVNISDRGMISVMDALVLAAECMAAAVRGGKVSSVDECRVREASEWLSSLVGEFLAEHPALKDERKE